jgi:uncharacterized membrane protein
MNPQLFLIFSIVFVTLDLLWIQYFSKIIGPMIEKIQGSPIEMNYIGAILAYLTMLIAYAYLAYDGDKPNYFKAIILGLAIYGTYEFTNYTTFKDWDPRVLAIDISWGMTVSVLSVFITNLIYNFIN